MPTPNAPSYPTYAPGYVSWANMYQGNVQAPPPTPASYYNYATLGQPPVNSPPTGGWTNPQAWANYYQGTAGFTPPAGGNTPAAALGAENLATYSPNNPNLLGWEETYGNPRTALQQNPSWAQSLGSPPNNGNYAQGNGGWANPNAWAAYYSGTHGFTAPTGANTPAAALAAAAALSQSSPYDPNILGWEMDYGQPGNILSANPDWATSLGTPQTNDQGIGIPQGYNTGVGAWESPLAWAAYYGGQQGFQGAQNNNLQGAYYESQVTNPKDPSLLGWELDYGNPQTVINTITSSPQYQQFEQQLGQYEGALTGYNAVEQQGQQGINAQNAADVQAQAGLAQARAAASSFQAENAAYWAEQSAYGKELAAYNQVEADFQAQANAYTAAAPSNFVGPTQTAYNQALTNYNVADALYHLEQGNFNSSNQFLNLALQNYTQAYNAAIAGRQARAQASAPTNAQGSHTPPAGYQATSGQWTQQGVTYVGYSGGYPYVWGPLTNYTAVLLVSPTDEFGANVPHVMNFNGQLTFDAQGGTQGFIGGAGGGGGGGLTPILNDIGVGSGQAGGGFVVPQMPYIPVTSGLVLGNGLYSGYVSGPGAVPGLSPLSNDVIGTSIGQLAGGPGVTAPHIGNTLTLAGMTGGSNFMPEGPGTGEAANAAINRAFAAALNTGNFSDSTLASAAFGGPPFQSAQENVPLPDWNPVPEMSPAAEAALIPGIVPGQEIEPPGNIGDVSGPVTAPDWFNLPSIADAAREFAGWVQPYLPPVTQDLPPLQLPPTWAGPGQFPSADAPFMTPEANPTAPGVAITPYTQLTGSAPSDAEISPQGLQDIGAPPPEPTFASFQPTSPEPTFASYQPYSSTPSAMPEIGATSLYQGGYGEPTLEQLPPPAAQTASEAAVAKYGTSVTLRQIISDAAKQTGGTFEGGYTLQQVFEKLGAGIDTPIDLTNPDLKTQIYNAINGPDGGGYIAGSATPMLLTAMAKGGLNPQAIADAASDVQQDVAEGPGAYGQAYTTVPVYGSSTPNLAPNYNPTGLVPPVDIPSAFGSGEAVPLPAPRPGTPGGTMMFVHGIQSMYEKFGLTSDQAETIMSNYAQANGLNFQVLEAPDNQAAKTAALNQYFSSHPGETGLVVGYSQGADAINNMAFPDGVQKVTLGLSSQGGVNTEFPGVDHGGLLAAWANQGNQGATTEAWPGSGSGANWNPEPIVPTPIGESGQGARIEQGGVSFLGAGGSYPWISGGMHASSGIPPGTYNIDFSGVGPQGQSGWGGQVDPAIAGVTTNESGNNIAGPYLQAQGIEIHSLWGAPGSPTASGTLGCFGITQANWPAFQQAMQGYAAQNGPLTLTITDAGNGTFSAVVAPRDTGSGLMPNIQLPQMSTSGPPVDLAQGYGAYNTGSVGGGIQGAPPDTAQGYGAYNAGDVGGGIIQQYPSIQAGYSYIPGAFGEIDPYNFSSAPYPSGGYGGGGFPDAAALLGYGDVLGPGLMPLPQEGASTDHGGEDTWPLQPSSFGSTDWSKFNPAPSSHIEDVRSGYIPAAEPESLDFQWDSEQPAVPAPIQAGYRYLPGSFGEIDPYNFSSAPTPGGAYGGGSEVAPAAPQMQAGYNYPSGTFGEVPPEIQAGYRYIPGTFGDNPNPYGFGIASSPQYAESIPQGSSAGHEFDSPPYAEQLDPQQATNQLDLLSGQSGRGQVQYGLPEPPAQFTSPNYGGLPIEPPEFGLPGMYQAPPFVPPDYGTIPGTNYTAPSAGIPGLQNTTLEYTALDGSTATGTFSSGGRTLTSNEDVEGALYNNGSVDFTTTDGLQRTLTLNSDGTSSTTIPGLTQPGVASRPSNQITANAATWGTLKDNGLYSNTALVKDYGYDGAITAANQGSLATSNPLEDGVTYTTPVSTFGGPNDPNNGAISGVPITTTEYTVSFPFASGVARGINANGGVTLIGPNGNTISRVFVSDIGPNMNAANVHNGQSTATSINRGADLSPALIAALGAQTDQTVRIQYNSGGSAVTYSAHPTAAQLAH